MTTWRDSLKENSQLPCKRVNRIVASHSSLSETRHSCNLLFACLRFVYFANFLVFRMYISTVRTYRAYIQYIIECLPTRLCGGGMHAMVLVPKSSKHKLVCCILQLESLIVIIYELLIILFNVHLLIIII